jgi:hypothetical protein
MLKHGAEPKSPTERNFCGKRNISQLPAPHVRTCINPVTCPPMNMSNCDSEDILSVHPKIASIYTTLSMCLSFFLAAYPRFRLLFLAPNHPSCTNTYNNQGVRPPENSHKMTVIYYSKLF